MLRYLPLCVFFAVSACVDASPTTTSSQDSASSIARWNELNSQCRGVYSDQTEMICEMRTNLGDQLEASGFCYGENAEFGYQARWDICDRMR
jgi:hypothetical protein